MRYLKIFWKVCKYSLWDGYAIHAYRNSRSFDNGIEIIIFKIYCFDAFWKSWYEFVRWIRHVSYERYYPSIFFSFCCSNDDDEIDLTASQTTPTLLFNVRQFWSTPLNMQWWIDIEMIYIWRPELFFRWVKDFFV